jgi:hypothetical protein
MWKQRRKEREEIKKRHVVDAHSVVDRSTQRQVKKQYRTNFNRA